MKAVPDIAVTPVQQVPCCPSDVATSGRGGDTLRAVEFVSEPICPDAGTFDAAAMATGTPGLPTGFSWRDRHFQIGEVLSAWKASESFNHAGGERYLRKHFWKVRLNTGEIATVYALRKVKAGENTKRRWWLYTLEQPENKP